MIVADADDGTYSCFATGRLGGVGVTEEEWLGVFGRSGVVGATRTFRYDARRSLSRIRTSAIAFPLFDTLPVE